MYTCTYTFQLTKFNPRGRGEFPILPLFLETNTRAGWTRSDNRSINEWEKGGEATFCVSSHASSSTLSIPPSVLLNRALSPYPESVLASVNYTRGSVIVTRIADQRNYIDLSRSMNSKINFLAVNSLPLARCVHGEKKRLVLAVTGKFCIVCTYLMEKREQGIKILLHLELRSRNFLSFTFRILFSGLNLFEEMFLLHGS